MKTSSKTLKNQSTKITLSSTAFMLKRCCCEKNGRVYIFFQSILSLLNVMPTIVSVLIPGLILNELVGNKRINVLSVYVGIAIITPLVHQVINSILTKRLATINFGLTVKLKKISMNMLQTWFMRLLRIRKFKLYGQGCVEHLSNHSIQLIKLLI